MKKLFLFAALLASASLALGQQFKWVDKDGRVQYGDSPPPGAKVTRLKPPPAGTPTTASSTSPASKDGKKDKPLTPEEAFQKRQKEAKEQQEKTAKEQADANTKKENCARAQDQLRTLSSGQRITRIDQKGERQFLDEQQLAAEQARAQAAVREACSG